MLQRIDEMDRANEKLMEEISELEEIKDQLEERIDREEERKREVEREYKEQTVRKSLIYSLYLTKCFQSFVSFFQGLLRITAFFLFRLKTQD